MTSPLIASLNAAGLVTNVNLEAVKDQYLEWCQSKANPELAADALAGVAGSSKHPARVISNANVRYDVLDDAGETGSPGSGGGGGGLSQAAVQGLIEDYAAPATAFANLDAAVADQALLYDAGLTAFAPADIPSDITPAIAPALLRAQNYDATESTLPSWDLDEAPPAGGTVVLCIQHLGGADPEQLMPAAVNGLGATWISPGITPQFGDKKMRVFVGSGCDGESLTINMPRAGGAAYALYRAMVFDKGDVVSGTTQTLAMASGAKSVTLETDHAGPTGVVIFADPATGVPASLHDGETPKPWTVAVLTGKYHQFITGVCSDMGASATWGITDPNGAQPGGAVGFVLA